MFQSLLINTWKKNIYPRTSEMQQLFHSLRIKSSKTDSWNYQGISLLSIAEKILVHVTLNHLITSISENLPEAQCSFCPDCRTINTVAAVHQLQEKCFKQNIDVYATFIDLIKAFDMVNREAFWVICQNVAAQKDSSIPPASFMTTWLVLFSPIGNFQIHFTFQKVWSRAMCLHPSCPTFSTYVCS